MAIKFPCKILIASLLTHSWTGGGGVALIKSNIFLGLFHENRASLNEFFQSL